MKTAIKYSFLILALSCGITFHAQEVDAQELVSGSVIGRHIFGLATDVNGDPLLVGEKPLIFNASDFEQSLTIDDKTFVISGFGDTLGGLYLTRYDATSKQYLDTTSFELAGIDGLSGPRGGQATTWNTVLFGEAKLVDAAKPQGFIDGFKAFYKGKSEMVKPYHYGWVAEAVVLDKQGKAKLIKNYAVGRVFASQLMVMPDGKTLYLFDRDNAGILYLYVAEEPNSLTKGTLYGISLQGGKLVYDVLGHQSALKIKFKLKKIGFSKVFNVAAKNDDGCPAKFVHVNTIYGEECLKLKKRNRKYAGLFEPVRMLAIKRKGSPLTKFASVEFGQHKNQVVLTMEGGSSRTYELGKGVDIDSKYIIQETPL
jgi:hypothetical protein